MVAFGHKSAADCAIGQPDLQPASVSKVVAAIQNIREASQKEIITATGLSERSVKSALSILICIVKVKEAITPSDLRKKTYLTEG